MYIIYKNLLIMWYVWINICRIWASTTQQSLLSVPAQWAVLPLSMFHIPSWSLHMWLSLLERCTSLSYCVSQAQVTVLISVFCRTKWMGAVGHVLSLTSKHFSRFLPSLVPCRNSLIKKNHTQSMQWVWGPSLYGISGNLLWWDSTIKWTLLN